MGEMVYERARKEAKAIREAYHIGAHGLGDLERLANTLGAEVFYESLGPDTAGFIIKDEGEPFAAIYVNSDDILERQRFTLAHEIGHLVERRRIAGDDEYSFTDYRDERATYNLHEFFADEFAGELLMPPLNLIDTYMEGGPYIAASTFGVSPAAVERRLARLQKHPPKELLENGH